jgi:hypothetical protein
VHRHNGDGSAASQDDLGTPVGSRSAVSRRSDARQRDSGVLLVKWLTGQQVERPEIPAAAATQAAYTRSVVAPSPPCPSRPATVRRSTPAVTPSPSSGAGRGCGCRCRGGRRGCSSGSKRSAGSTVARGRTSASWSRRTCSRSARRRAPACARRSAACARSAAPWSRCRARSAHLVGLGVLLDADATVEPIASADVHDAQVQSTRDQRSAHTSPPRIPWSSPATRGCPNRRPPRTRRRRSALPLTVTAGRLRRRLPRSHRAPCRVSRDPVPPRSRGERAADHAWTCRTVEAAIGLHTRGAPLQRARHRRSSA